MSGSGQRIIRRSRFQSPFVPDFTVRSSTLALLAILLPAVVAAQQPGAVIPAGQVGVAAGISLPTGQLADSYSAGFNLAGLVQLRLPTELVGLRAEVLWEHFERKEALVDVRNKNGVALTVNAMYFVPEYAIRPYFIGGMGFYRITDQGSRPGLNFGLGIDIPLGGMAAHAEARFHKVLTDNRSYATVPIAFGIRF